MPMKENINRNRNRNTIIGRLLNTIFPYCGIDCLMLRLLKYINFLENRGIVNL